MIKELKQQWFLVGLVLIFVFLLFDRTGQIAVAGFWLKVHHGPDIVIFLIFIMSGLIIETKQIKDGMRDISSTFAALLVIIIISPIAAILLSFIPLQKGFVIGLFIVAVMPTTLSSGVVMTGKAGGNMAHALFVTVFSNSISILSIPIILSLLLSFSFNSQYIEIDQISIMVRLSLLVLLPLTLGLVIKKFFLIIIKSKTKIKMQVLNQVLVIGIVFMAASGAQDMLNNNYKELFLIVAIVTIFHIILLLSSFYGAKLLKIGKGRYESVIFMGSQKTLPLSVIIQVTYFSEYDIALLVCVVHHFIHLMIDGYFAVKLKKHTLLY